MSNTLIGLAPAMAMSAAHAQSETIACKLQPDSRETIKFQEATELALAIVVLSGFLSVALFPLRVLLAFHRIVRGGEHGGALVSDQSFLIAAE